MVVTFKRYGENWGNFSSFLIIPVYPCLDFKSKNYINNCIGFCVYGSDRRNYG